MDDDCEDSVHHVRIHDEEAPNPKSSTSWGEDFQLPAIKGDRILARRNGPKLVGRLTANQFDFCDMHGNMCIGI